MVQFCVNSVKTPQNIKFKINIWFPHELSGSSEVKRHDELSGSNESQVQINKETASLMNLEINYPQIWFNGKYSFQSFRKAIETDEKHYTFPFKGQLHNHMDGSQKFTCFQVNNGQLSIVNTYTDSITTVPLISIPIKPNKSNILSFIDEIITTVFEFNKHNETTVSFNDDSEESYESYSLNIYPFSGMKGLFVDLTSDIILTLHDDLIVKSQPTSTITLSKYNYPESKTPSPCDLHIVSLTDLIELFLPITIVSRPYTPFDRSQYVQYCVNKGKFFLELDHIVRKIKTKV